MDKNECIIKVKDFLKKHCDNEINKLLELNIGTIKENSEFGKPDDYRADWNMDADDSIIARMVLYLLYSDEILNLTYEKIGKEYRGDTIFTPGNIMGKKEDLRKKNEKTFYSKNEDEINKLSEKQKKDLDGKIKYFTDRYHTIPNMMLLPNEKIIVRRNNKHCKESLNQYRGMNNPGFADYIDLFLLELQNYINEKKCSDEIFEDLCKANDIYFKEYDKKLIKFIDSHFFDIMYIKVGDTYLLKEEFKFKHYVRWISNRGYVDEVNKFIESFDTLLRYRKVKMKERLRDILHNVDC